MSASESEHRRLDEDRFEISYEELVERRIENDGPVSPEQIKRELKNEIRYDAFTSPDDAVRLTDSESIDEIFEDLRQRNRNGDLPYEIGVLTNLEADYFMKKEEPKVQGPKEESPYWVE